MPVSPTTYTSGPILPQQLNTDLYSFDASVNGANGILFFTHRPILQELLWSAGTAYAALSNQPIAGGGSSSFAPIDTSALFSWGADLPGVSALFTFNNQVKGSGGAPNGYGGQWLAWNFAFLEAITTPPGGVGATMFLNGSSFDLGVFQYGATGHNNCAWYLDLINPGSGLVNTWQPGFWWLTGSSPIPVVSAALAGQSCRMGWLWQGVSTGGGTVGAIPDPVRSWGTVTSAALNTSIGSCFTLLNNPPMLRVSDFSSQSLTTATNTKITFPVTPNVDSYSSWSTATSVYTAPLPGLYLFCPTIVWGTASSAGIRRCGLTVTPGGTGAAQDYLGPTYLPPAVGPGLSGIGFTVTAVARVLNLSKGDTVSAYGYQNSGGNLSLDSAYATRMIGAYMNATAPAGTVITYAVPDASFRWQAGALSGTALTAAFSQHVGQDISFLMNKPYFTAYQGTAQTGFTSTGTYFQVNMDTLGALPAGGNGDNYNGWSASSHRYVSQLAGWYLCVADLYAVPPVSGTAGLLTAGLFVSSSGSITPSVTPDAYQQVPYPVSTGGSPPGVTAIGLYYLLPGEYVYPVMATQNWGGSWGTFVQSGSEAVHSQFSCWWVAE